MTIHARRHPLTFASSRLIPFVTCALCPVGMTSAAHAHQPSPPPETPAPASTSESTPTPVTISTDRPSFSDGTGITPPGRINLETGYTFTFRDRDDAETQRHNGPELLARLGLIEDRFELRFLTSGYTWSRTDDSSGAGFQSTEGFSDIALGLKLKLLDQDGAFPRLALGAQTTLGAGSDSTSSQMPEPTLKLLWSYDLAALIDKAWAGVTLGGNVNVAFPTTDSDRFTQAQWSIYLSFPLVDRTTAFVEYFGIGPASKGGDAAHSVDLGAVYLLTDTIQLDARVGFGLNNEADNMFAGAGISFLF